MTCSEPIAGALNFKDVMLAYGKLSRELMAGGYSQGRLGFEFAGTVPAGAGSPAGPPRRVMGVARQAIATSVGAPQYLVRTQGFRSLKQCIGQGCLGAAPVTVKNRVCM